MTAAKLEVYGTCAIDLPAGPSEVLVVADHTADPRLVAIDLLCQAEHGPDSPALVITTDPDLAARVEAEIAGFLPLLPRRDILRSALATHGEALLATSLEEALDFANAYAPEHASVLTADADSDAGRLVNAGSVYVGRWSPESAGDYASGANHVLPTGGLARSHSPLGVRDFGSWRQVQTLTRAGLESIRPVIEALAAAEGLDAHRMAASIRFETAPATTLQDENPLQRGGLNAPPGRMPAQYQGNACVGGDRSRRDRSGRRKHGNRVLRSHCCPRSPTTLSSTSPSSRKAIGRSTTTTPSRTPHYAWVRHWARPSETGPEYNVSATPASRWTRRWRRRPSTWVDDPTA